MQILKMIPALLSVLLWTNQLKPTPVVDVVKVHNLFVEAPKIWPTMTVTKTVGVPTTKVEPTVPLVTITATTASTFFKDTPPSPAPLPKATPKPYPFPLPLGPCYLSTAYILSALAAPRFSVLDLVVGTFLGITSLWLLYRFPLLIHIRCIREVTIRARNWTFDGIVNGIIYPVKGWLLFLEDLVDYVVWYRGHQLLVLALFTWHRGSVTSSTLQTCLATYVFFMVCFLKWGIFKQGVLEDWQIVIAARYEVLGKAHAWYENREDSRRIDEVFERSPSKISIEECLFREFNGPVPVPTFTTIIKAMVHDFFANLWHLCVLVLEERCLVFSQILPHTKKLLVKTWTILFGYNEEELVWNGFLACWIWFLECIRQGVEMSLYGARWSFKMSLYGAREKIFPALKTFLAAVYFYLPMIRLLLTHPAAVLRKPRESVSSPPRPASLPPITDAEFLNHMLAKHLTPPRPEWMKDPFVTQWGMKPIRRREWLWEPSPRSRIYPTFS